MIQHAPTCPWHPEHRAPIEEEEEQEHVLDAYRWTDASARDPGNLVLAHPSVRSAYRGARSATGAALSDLSRSEGDSMPYRETVSELVEALADLCGVYNQGLRFAGMTVEASREFHGSGAASGHENHADDCGCRLCWTGRLQARIRAAVSHDTPAPPWKHATSARQAAIERRITAVRTLLGATVNCTLPPPALGLIAEAESLMRLLEADVARGLDLREVPTHGAQ
jgi:hypothetical protein